MTITIEELNQIKVLPDHTQLPESNGEFVKNFQEHPQSILLTDSIKPILDKIHTDGQYCIGQDSGIYWRLTEPPERGAEAPDWFYVANVPPMLDGEFRRYYVLWQEKISPLIVFEFVSGDGSEERDRTPLVQEENRTGQKPGKFWIYEQIIRPLYYGIYEVKRARVEMYFLAGDKYELMEASDRGHYPIPPLGVEVGIWQGRYQNMELPWLRFWDEFGNLLLNGEERAEKEKERAEKEKQRAETAEKLLEQEQEKVERLMAQLKAQGIEPEV